MPGEDAGGTEGFDPTTLSPADATRDSSVSDAYRSATSCGSQVRYNSGESVTV